MYTQKKINNQRFSIRLCNVAEHFGFKRVGPFEKMLRNMHPQNKIVFRGSHMRPYKMLKEIDEFKQNN